MMPGIEVDADAMRRAAEKAIRPRPIWPTIWCEGVPFREAHEAVARAVNLAATRELSN